MGTRSMNFAKGVYKILAPSPYTESEQISTKRVNTHILFACRFIIILRKDCVLSLGDDRQPWQKVTNQVGGF